MALVEYSICGPEGHFQSAPSASSITPLNQLDQKPILSNSHSTTNHSHQKHYNGGGASLNTRLKHYQSYLDDHDAFRRRRSKWIAMKKYCLIMRSIKIKSKDLFQFEYHEDDEDDDELVDCEQSLDDPFDRASHNQQHQTRQAIFPGAQRQSMTSASKCDINDCNKILRRHRARIVNGSNPCNPAWTNSSQQRANNSQHDDSTHNPDDMAALDCFS